MEPSLVGLLVAGALTFASPCVLPLIPAYLAALGGGALAPRRGRMVLTASAFAVGMSSVFVALGAAASVVGEHLLAHRGALLFVSGTVMVLFGLRALGLLRIPLLDREARPVLARVRTGGTVAAAFLFGAAFAIGWSPCVGPMLVSALTYAAAHASTPWRGAGLLAVYSAGIAIPLVATAALAEQAIGWLRRSGSVLPMIERATGVLLVGFGLWTAYDSHAINRILAPDPLNAPGPLHSYAPAVTGPRLIEFVSQDCPACRRMVPVVAGIEASCSGLGEQTVLRVDTDTDQGRTLALGHNVVAVPTFVVIDERSMERARFIGEWPAKKIEAAVENAFGMRCAAKLERTLPPG
jgi:cytochrome c-type biogenesis protein